MPRRWFSDEAMDLIVWYDENNEIAGFQLCYDKPFAEHALSWRSTSGFEHSKVDDGEGSPGGHKETPLLVANGNFNLKEIAEKFKVVSKDLDKELAKFIYEKLQD